jgi:hypothetical protein
MTVRTPRELPKKYLITVVYKGCQVGLNPFLSKPHVIDTTSKVAIILETIVFEISAW